MRERSSPSENSRVLVGCLRYMRGISYAVRISDGRVAQDVIDHVVFDMHVRPRCEDLDDDDPPSSSIIEAAPSPELAEPRCSKSGPKCSR
jgi:hypothetical protein